MGLLYILILYAFWTLCFPIGKYMLQFSPPIFLTGLRMTIAGVILIGYLKIRKQMPSKITKRQLFAILFLGIFSIYLSNILELWGLTQISAAKTCFIYSLSPFFTAFFSYLHFKEKMTPMKWLGITIGVAGTLPVVCSNPTALLGVGLPEIAVVGAALFAVYGWILLRMIVKDESLSPFFANGTSMFIGGTLALITSFLFDGWNPIPIAEGSFKALMGSILFLTFVSNIFCYNLYGYLLKKYTATLLSLFGLLSPLFASVSSYFLLGEPISPNIVGSTFVVLLGLFLVHKEEQRLGYTEERST